MPDVCIVQPSAAALRDAIIDFTRFDLDDDFDDALEQHISKLKKVHRLLEAGEQSADICVV